MRPRLHLLLQPGNAPLSHRLSGAWAQSLFSEAVNARGNSLTLTEQVLRDARFLAEADAILAIRKRTIWSQYVVGLFQNIQQAMRTHMTAEKLRFLLYPKGLAEKDHRAIEKDDAGVVWL